jgi:autotransporter translocation and assembly factor TamB
MDLDGLIKVRQDDADIAIKLLGSTERPRVIFESEPPMSQSTIIGLLVFNKSPDDLDPDQSASVSNSQSAMASGAFGLASLYLFASTPIQNVGYDPASQTYAIKFSLPGGASLEVGSGADQSRHLTLRKRLARRWVLQTEVRREEADQRNAVTTFLEWFQRY